MKKYIYVETQKPSHYLTTKINSNLKWTRNKMLSVDITW